MKGMFKTLALFVTCAASIIADRSTAAEAGFINNDGDQLTFTPIEDGFEMTMSQPDIMPGALISLDSWYYGAGDTHEGGPSILWDGAPTDVGLEITDIFFNGNSVSDGFLITSGEYDAFPNVFGLGEPPANPVGLNTPFLLVDSQSILDAQLGDPKEKGYTNHHHTFAYVSEMGDWDVTFRLLDLVEGVGYNPSEPFTLSFSAVPEPGTLALLAGATLLISRRRR